MPICRCIAGDIVEHGTTTGQPGLTVTVGTSTGLDFRPLGTTQTDDAGHFSIDIGKFVATAATGVRYQVRVLQGSVALAAKGDTAWIEGFDACSLHICVTYPESCGSVDPGDVPGQAGDQVYGLVRHVDGSLVSGVRVELWSVTLTGSDEETVSSGAPVTTDATGAFIFSDPTGPKNLFIKVFTLVAEGETLVKDKYVGGSAVYYAASAPLRIDVTLCDDALRGPSEWARIEKSVTDLVDPAPSVLTTENLAFLSGQSGWPLKKLVDWELARRTAGNVRFASGLEAEAAYGLFREGCPRTLDGLCSRPAAAVRHAIRRAAEVNIVSNEIKDAVESVVAALATGRAAALNDGTKDSLSAILATSNDVSVSFDSTDVQAFCEAYVAYSTRADFWTTHVEMFDGDEVAEAQRLLALASIGLAYAPCVAGILTILGTAGAEVVGTWPLTAEGADPSWTAAAAAVTPLPEGLHGTDEEQKAQLARLMYEHAQVAYRHAATLTRLQGTTAFGSDASGFFADHGSIDLETARMVDGASFGGSPPDAATFDVVRAVQRLYRIAPSVGAGAAMERLYSKGYQSARDVARRGRSRFLVHYAGTDADLLAEGREVYARARGQAGMAAAFFLQAAPTLSRLSVDFVPDVVDFDDDRATANIPGWSGLFGGANGCRCTWCRSIHGPAAYLVDLLQWLSLKTPATGEDVPEGQPPTALAALEGFYLGSDPLPRRFDIGKLLLTCENTERALPYIDLATELLEAVVAGTWDPATTVVPDTTEDTPDLLAQPQNVRMAAYNALAVTGGADPDPVKRAHKLPFHRAVVEARAFLAHLGVDRTDLMRAFMGRTAVSVREISAEELGISMEAAVVLETASTTLEAEAAYWPLDSLEVAPSVTAFRRACEITYPDILDLLYTLAVTGDAPLGVVVTGSDPYDVDAYLIGVADGADVDPPSAAQYSSMRQFLRLWRATGWTMLELDKVLQGLAALHASDVWNPASWTHTGEPVTDVGDLHRLQRMTGLDPLTLIAWFSPIDTRLDRSTKDDPARSLYDRTFLNPSLFPASVVEADTTPGFPFRLATERAEVDDDHLPLGDYLDPLHAVLGVGADEVAALVEILDEAEMLAHNDSDAPNVCLVNLSLLYRWTTLARAAGLTPTEAFRLRTVSEIDPFASPSGAITFLEEAGAWADAGWSVDEVAYLLQQGVPERVAPTDGFLRDALGRTRDALQTAFRTTVSGTTLDSVLDDLGRRIASELGVDRTVIDELRARTWSSLLPSWFGTVQMPTEERVALPGATEIPLPAGSVVTLADDTELTNMFGSHTLTAGTRVRLSGAPGTLTLVASSVIALPAGCRVATSDLASWTVADPSLGRPHPAFVVPTDSASPLDHTLTGPVDVIVVDGEHAGKPGSIDDDAAVRLEDATAPVGLPADTAITAPTSLLPIAPSGAVDLLARFARAGFWDVASDTSSGDPWADIVREDGNTYEHDFAVLEAIAKAAMLIGKVKADADERTAWYGLTDAASPALWMLLDPASLAPGDITAAVLPTAYGRLKRTVDLFALRLRLPGSTPTFAELISGDNLAGGDVLAASLAARTGWDLTQLQTVASADWLGTPGVYRLRTLLDRMDLARRVGADPTVVSGWGNPGRWHIPGDDLDTVFTPNQAAAVVATARSRYPDSAAWAAVARPVRDRIRKAQRDALVSYLIAQAADDAVQDADDLYERYLIDVSMNPEMLTSRVLQATLAVQLFVHRCLFGLERYTAGTDYDMGDWFTDEDRAEWEWMRTYRVWEAARKVFLYPENWIEPELRDDKTPFYKTLEADLKQGDVTKERVEEVFLDYLDRVHDVANLQVLACYHQVEDDADGTSVDLFHVFARTRSTPPTYWYRRREDASTWTPWESVACGIQGDQLVPVVSGRRLFLLWAEFTKASSPDGSAPDEWWNVSLAMSEHRGGKWTPKRTSTDALNLGSNTDVAEYHLHDLDVDQYALTSAVDGSTLAVTVWAYLATSSASRADGWVTIQSWIILGSFALDLCTMDMVPSAASFTEGSRVTPDPDGWLSPGFRSGDDDPVSITLYAGETDPNTGVAVGDPVPGEILGDFPDGTLVVPNQWQDFVSQSPFFAAIGTRSFFVDTGSGNTTDPASAASVYGKRAGTIAGDASGGTDPGGTADEDLTDEQKETYSRYLAAAQYSSATTKLSEIGFATTTLSSMGVSTLVTESTAPYRFYNFYHPHICTFIEAVRRDGILGLSDPDPEGTFGDLFRQQKAGLSADAFAAAYDPTDLVDYSETAEDIDFSYGDAYGAYNWEIFFHIPLYVASRLADEERYDDAIRWLHTMFDPRTRTAVPDDAPASAQWWKVKPFLDAVSASVTDWIDFTGEGADPASQAAFEAQVAAWLADPFDPHALARLRPGTYQKVVVMRYIETLLAWGDHLFTQDTMESINEATQLYVYAKKVLGDRPEELDPPSDVTAMSYNGLATSDPGLDSFGNALVALENGGFSASPSGGSGSGETLMTGLGYTPYFCVPPNARLLSYWDTVADRLFKVRNGMNIAGVVRSLALFQPPIDPALLVRAAAAGIDIGSALDGVAAVVPHHRFSVMVGRAQALTGTVRALGQALLAALEKRDAEALALLRQGHEETLLAAVRDLKERQVDEAEENLQAAKRQAAMVTARKDYYSRLIDGHWIAEETKANEKNKSAVVIDDVAAGISHANAILSWIPSEYFGTFTGAKIGGEHLHNALSATTTALLSNSGILRSEAGRLTTVASYKRRAQEWRQQKDQADKELRQLGHQITAAELRRDVAKKDLANQDLQIAQSAEVSDWMHAKYTNQELYDWMVGQISSLHFQAYQLALATAKKAEACYNYELGRADSFVQSVYWDGLRKGLLAGERLSADLDRMDAAYLDNDAREYELTKHVSLAQLDGFALQMLKTGGECYFEVPEAWFDADCPGHYFRRLQSVGLSIACVTGPQGSVNAQLTLQAHRTRTVATAGDPDWTLGDYTSIVTSVALNDLGLFSADLKDSRYLPFERRGAVSKWQLRLTAQTWRQLDWDSITDVTLHLRYTARDGGAAFRNTVAAATLEALKAVPVGFSSVAFPEELAAGTGAAFSARRDASDAWYEAQFGTDPASTLTIGLDETMVPRIEDYAYLRVFVIPVLAATGSTGDLPSACAVVFEETEPSLSAGPLTFSNGVTYFSFNVAVAPPGDLVVTFDDGYDFTLLSDVIVILVPTALPEE